MNLTVPNPWWIILLDNLGLNFTKFDCLDGLCCNATMDSCYSSESLCLESHNQLVGEVGHDKCRAGYVAYQCGVCRYWHGRFIQDDESTLEYALLEDPVVNKKANPKRAALLKKAWGQSGKVDRLKLLLRERVRKFPLHDFSDGDWKTMQHIDEGINGPFDTAHPTKAPSSQAQAGEPGGSAPTPS